MSSQSRLRALMSAADAGSLWDLRCELRERLIQFTNDRYPQSLPRFALDAAEPGIGVVIRTGVGFGFSPLVHAGDPVGTCRLRFMCLPSRGVR